MTRLIFEIKLINLNLFESEPTQPESIQSDIIIASVIIYTHKNLKYHILKLNTTQIKPNIQNKVT